MFDQCAVITVVGILRQWADAEPSTRHLNGPEASPAGAAPRRTRGALPRFMRRKSALPA